MLITDVNKVNASLWYEFTPGVSLVGFTADLHPVWFVHGQYYIGLRYVSLSSGSVGKTDLPMAMINRRYLDNKPESDTFLELYDVRVFSDTDSFLDMYNKLIAERVAIVKNLNTLSKKGGYMVDSEIGLIGGDCVSPRTRKLCATDSFAGYTRQTGNSMQLVAVDLEAETARITQYKAYNCETYNVKPVTFMNILDGDKHLFPYWDLHYIVSTHGLIQLTR